MTLRLEAFPCLSHVPAQSSFLSPVHKALREGLLLSKMLTEQALSSSQKSHCAVGPEQIP